MRHALLLVLVLSSVFGALPDAAADGVRVTSKPGFSATLRPDGQTFAIDVRFHNPTSDVVTLWYGDCSLTYVLRVGGKQYTFPESQAFAYSRVCTGRLNTPSIAARSSLVLFSTGVREPLARALKSAKSRFSGEFHFRYSRVGQPLLIVEVYKTP